MAAKTARSTKMKNVNGRVVSARSKTGDSACSAAMGEWVRTRKEGTTPASVFAILGQCRAKARAMRQADSHRNAGNEAKAQRLDAIASGKKGPITAKDRLAKARELVAARVNKAKPAAAKPSLLQQANKHRGYMESKSPTTFKNPSTMDQASHNKAVEIAQQIRSKAKVGGRPTHIEAQDWEHNTNLGERGRAAVRSHLAPDVHNELIKQSRTGTALTDAKYRLHQSRMARASKPATPAPAAKPSLLEQASKHRASKGSTENRVERLMNVAANRGAKLQVRASEMAATGQGKIDRVTNYGSRGYYDQMAIKAADQGNALKASASQLQQRGAILSKRASKLYEVTTPPRRPDQAAGPLPKFGAKPSPSLKAPGRNTADRIAKAKELKAQRASQPAAAKPVAPTSPKPSPIATLIRAKSTASVQAAGAKRDKRAATLKAAGEHRASKGSPAERAQKIRVTLERKYKRADTGEVKAGDEMAKMWRAAQSMKDRGEDPAFAMKSLAKATALAGKHKATKDRMKSHRYHFGKILNSPRS